MYHNVGTIDHPIWVVYLDAARNVGTVKNPVWIEFVEVDR